jgi:hypothetical protein
MGGAWPWRADDDSVVLAQRARFHLFLRLAARVLEVLSARRAGRGAGAVPRALLSAAGDVAGAALLQRSTRFALAPRLAADALDAAVWSPTPDQSELAAQTGVPLAVEAGVRLGPAGLVVPAVNAAVSALLARRRGQRATPSSFRWQTLGVVLGMGLRGYEERRRRAAEARHEVERAAELELAYLQGQHEVAMGADSVVDLVFRLSPLLAGSGCEHLPAQMLARWKQSLADVAGSRATYLGVALGVWQYTHNGASPDLRADVVFHLGPGDGTVLLTRAQVARLETALDGLGLRGDVRVALADPEAAWLPGRPRDLVLGDAMVRLPPDPGPAPHRFDPGPVAFVAAAVWCLDSAGPSGPGSSWAAVLPLTAAYTALAFWSDRAIDRRGDAAHPAILLAAQAVGLVEAVAATATMARSRGVTGIQRYPFLNPVNVTGLLAALYSRSLRPGQLALVGSGVAASVVLGLAALPEPLVAGDLLGELLWTAAGVAVLAPMDRTLQADADRRRAEQAEADHRARQAAYQAGRAFPLHLVAEAQAAVRREVAERRDQINPELAEELDRRLAEVDRRLEALA